jgi:hypothetical protein
MDAALAALQLQADAGDESAKVWAAPHDERTARVSSVPAHEETEEQRAFAQRALKIEDEIAFSAVFPPLSSARQPQARRRRKGGRSAGVIAPRDREIVCAAIGGNAPTEDPEAREAREAAAAAGSSRRGGDTYGSGLHIVPRGGRGRGHGK